VQNSQPSNPTIAKLLEADAELAAQEAELNAKIQSIGEKRHSLKTVIDMFAPVDTAPTPVVKPTSVAEDQLQPTPPDVVAPRHGAVTDIEVEAQALPTAQKQQAKKNSSPNSSKQGKKLTFTSTKEPSKNIEGWQQYVKDDFGNATLSEAVSEVMQQHSKQVLDIATIIDAIFVNDIPRKVRSTARERVSNVLSVGAKSGKWYRGKLGKYSMSQAAVKG